MKIDLGNPAIRDLKNFIKDTFIQPPKQFFIDIIESYDHILDTSVINIEEIMQDRKLNKNRIVPKERRIEQLLLKNKVRIQDNIIVSEYAEPIIKLLKLYKLDLAVPNKKTNTRNFSYKDAEEDEDEEDYIVPYSNTDLSSVKLNLFYNKDVKYKFVGKEKPAKLDKTISNLQTLKLKINGMLEHTIVPIKRKAICTEKDEYGAECGNIVHFCDTHLHSKIKCTDSFGGKGHLIKKPENAQVEENTVFYTYEGSDLCDSNSTELIICSLVELDQSNVICNAIYVNDSQSNYLLILAVEETIVEKLKEPILLKEDTSIHFLDDIYKSIQNYLNKYHDIKLTNQNKYVGQVISFICLNNIFYDIRMNSLIVGASGSGKSVWSEFLIPLFTFNYKIVLGTDITRNKFIGGRSNIVSSNSNSMFSAGYIATQNIIFAEECTNSLKDFKDVKVNQSNNIFHLVKAASGREIDVAIQGGQKVYPKASTILVGNLEQLDFTSEYKQYVANKYRKLGDERYKEAFPLFKPIEYYIDILKDVELAKAHAVVRQTYKNISGNHYVTRLPPAEQARYAFMIVLEDDLDNRRQKRQLKKEEILVNPKREQLINELSEIFLDEDRHVKKIPYKLKKQINDFYNDEYYDERNNFKTIFGLDKPINTHIENNIVMIMEQLVWMNKVYYNKEDELLTENDKHIIRDFLKYNYNTLSTKEASLITRPYINDFKILSEDAINASIDKNLELQNKKRKEKEDMEKLIKDTNILNDDEEESLL